MPKSAFDQGRSPAPMSIVTTKSSVKNLSYSLLLVLGCVGLPLSSAEAQPEELLADPNPLAYPTSVEAVEIDEIRELTLEAAIELVYANSPDLQTALLELEQAEAGLAEARAAYWPTVTSSADVTTRETDSVTTDFGTSGSDGLDTALNAVVQLDYDLFTSGQRVANLRAAKEQVRFSELEVSRRQEELRLTAATLYYDLQESGEQIRINGAFLDEAQQNLRDNRIRQEEGVGTRFDVLRAEVQFANARQALIQSQSQQRIARRDLARLLNLPPQVGIRSTAVERAEDWTLSLEESIVAALENRVELEQQLRQREIAQQQARAIRAGNRPQVGLFANYSWSDLLDDSSDDYRFGARIDWILTDGGRARSQARQQELAASIAEESFAETVDQVRFQVEESYYTLRANEENIETARVAVNQAREALVLANLRLDAGVGTQLDVLTAQSELTEAEGNLVSALLGYNRALAALQRAVSNLRTTL